MPDLSGRVALVTGANTGLGREVALQLVLANATVLLGCRDVAKGSEAEHEITALATAAGSHGVARVVHIDLSDLKQVARAADQLATAVPKLDILVNNAGVATQFPHTLTADGVEATFQVNYLGHFLLTTRLLPLLRRSRDGARVVHLTSGAHRGAPPEGVLLSRRQINNASALGPYARYGMAKLASLVFAKELDRRLFAASGLLSNAVHPGVVATDMLRPQNFRAMLGPRLGDAALRAARLRNALFAYSVREAALSLLYCAASSEVGRAPVHGQLVVPVATLWPPRHPKADDPDLGAELWSFSEALVEEALRPPPSRPA